MNLDRTIFAGTAADSANDPRTWEGLAEMAMFRCQRLARLCFVSTRTLNRFFRRKRNQTACDWMNELRLDLAWRRLATAGSVKEVAIDLGYMQASTFSRSFKDRFGMTPSARRDCCQIDSDGVQPVSGLLPAGTK